MNAIVPALALALFAIASAPAQGAANNVRFQLVGTVTGPLADDEVKSVVVAKLVFPSKDTASHAFVNVLVN